MKKRILPLLFSVMLLSLLLTGCIRTEVGVALKPDGSGTVSTAVLIKADAYETIKKSADPFEGQETYTETIDGAEYVGTKSTKRYKSAEELRTALLSLTFMGNVPAIQGRVSDSETQPKNSETTLAEGQEKTDFTTGAPIFKAADIEASGGTLTFKAVLNPQTDTGSESIAHMDMNEIYKLKVVVTMPGTVKTTSVGNVTDKTVTWMVGDITAENDIMVVSEAENGGLIPVYVFGAVLLALTAALTVLMTVRKKHK